MCYFPYDVIVEVRDVNLSARLPVPSVNTPVEHAVGRQLLINNLVRLSLYKSFLLQVYWGINENHVDPYGPDVEAIIGRLLILLVCKKIKNNI